MYQHLYQKFLEGHKPNIHFAAHSHYFWPDISFDAAAESWITASKYSDQKWDHILGEVLDETQGLIAKILNLSHPEQLAFAQNTHELVSRVLSCFMGQDKIKVLTTKSEFHSFKRQINRLKEYSNFEVTVIDNEVESFEDDLLSNINDDLDLIFISHVFYNSGKVISNSLIENIIDKKNKKTIFCLDGYHSFCAVPTDLSAFEGEIFYMAGGYKYAQAGEGMCFLTIPKGCKLRPAFTGWFASFESLEKDSDNVEYSDSGFRFWGATQDLTALYRFNAVWKQFFDMDLDIEKIHAYIQSLQTQFLNNLQIKDLFLETELNKTGHFLTLKCKNSDQAHEVHTWLKNKGFLTDVREERLRFGFGLYLTQENIESVQSLLNQNYFNLFP